MFAAARGDRSDLSRFALLFQIAWSADSRLLCSGSSDSTLKVSGIVLYGCLGDYTTLQALGIYWLHTGVFLLHTPQLSIVLCIKDSAIKNLGSGVWERG